MRESRAEKLKQSTPLISYFVLDALSAAQRFDSSSAILLFDDWRRLCGFTLNEIYTANRRALFDATKCAGRAIIPNSSIIERRFIVTNGFGDIASKRCSSIPYAAGAGQLAVSTLTGKQSVGVGCCSASALTR